jgi:RNA polymerase sigma-70 factor (ECF subfamily)
VQSAAEVAVSQAFAEAWRSAASFEASRASVLAWLTSIVRRIALRVGRAATVSAEKRNAGGSAPTARSADIRPIDTAMRSLTPAQRRAIELSYYRGLTVGEIAVQLGQPESGARELLRSAMQELRTALGAGGAVFDDHVVTRA